MRDGAAEGQQTGGTGGTAEPAKVEA
jgi:hypothetical protein